MYCDCGSNATMIKQNYEKEVALNNSTSILPHEIHDDDENVGEIVVEALEESYEFGLENRIQGNDNVGCLHTRNGWVVEFQ